MGSEISILTRSFAVYYMFTYLCHRNQVVVFRVGGGQLP